jgi:protein-S-isoprenylcysteine O-methyltransferase Ste14
MALTDEMSQQGRWLFRWRSYLPITLFSLLAISIIGLRWPFGSYEFHEVWEFGCLMLSFLGLAIRCATVGYVPHGTSGRNTKKQKADSLNTTGLYSIVRHPLYVGNYLIGLGVVLVWINWWVPVVYTLLFWLYYERIMVAEEGFLEEQFGDDFRQWAAMTPAFLPQFSHWQRPSLPFSLRVVLQREYSGLLLIVLLHSGLEVAEHLWLEGRPKFGPDWSILFIFGVAVYLVLRTLKKRTAILNVAGR